MHNLSNLSKTVTHQSSTIRVCGFACELLSKNRDILSIPLYVYTTVVNHCLCGFMYYCKPIANPRQMVPLKIA